MKKQRSVAHPWLPSVFVFTLLLYSSSLFAQNDPPIPTHWTFQTRVSTPGYKGTAKFPYFPSVLVNGRGELLDARKVAPKAKQPGLLAISEDHGGSKHSGIHLYTFSPNRPDKLTLLSVVRSPVSGNHMETPWLFIRPQDGKLCMTAHVSGDGGQVTILMSTEDGVNWTHEGTAIPIGGKHGHTGYARGYIHNGKITYVSLNRGGGNPTWRISQDRDGDGVDAKMVGDPFTYFNKTKGRGTEPPPHQIIRRGNQFLGFFLRKQLGSHGGSIGNATLLLHRYKKSKANNSADLFRHIAEPGHVLIKPGENKYVHDGVTSACVFHFQNNWYMYVAGRGKKGNNHLLIYTGSN